MWLNLLIKYIKTCNFEPFCYAIKSVLPRREHKLSLLIGSMPSLLPVLLSLPLNYIPYSLDLQRSHGNHHGNGYRSGRQKTLHGLCRCFYSFLGRENWEQPQGTVYKLRQEALTVCIAELVWIGLWAVWAEQHASYTQFLPRPDQPGRNKI